jgi:hypothetical protein
LIWGTEVGWSELKTVTKMYVGVGVETTATSPGRLYIDDIRVSKGVPAEPNAAP